MKDQYAGDVNDYRKYGILRCLAKEGFRLGVCWMLTSADRRNDGFKVEYLYRCGTYRKHDKELFDALARTVTPKAWRGTHLIEKSGVLAGAVFHSEWLGDSTEERDQYFAGAWDALGGVDLVFFDPDNGFEINSVARGTRDSRKYVYWEELKEAWKRKKSILVYQHYPRVPRKEFEDGLIAKMGRFEPPPAGLAALRTESVLFLLAVQPSSGRGEVADPGSEERKAAAALEAIARRWEGQVEVRRARGCVLPESGLEKICERFGHRFEHWSLRLPREDVCFRRAGCIHEAGWLIQFLFGRDEAGEYLDYYATHRMTDDDHIRIREDGREERLPALSTHFLLPEDPREQKAAEAAQYRGNREIAKMLVAKGFNRFSLNMSLAADLTEEHLPLEPDR